MKDFCPDTPASAPIGIFDSGFGGLTVMRELIHQMPQENLLYFADSARFPYGTKSAATVIRFATDIVRFFMQHKVKMVVAACNSASALALDALAENFDVPLLGVIQPGAHAAVSATKNGKIGVIGTRATVASQAYQTAIYALNPDLEVYQQACPIFVSMVEEGWVDKEVTHMVVKEYLEPLKQQGVDVLLLGCTHYPLIKKAIAQFMGDDVVLVDSGRCCAQDMEALLSKGNLKNQQSGTGTHLYYVTDLPEKFCSLGQQFLDREIPHVTVIDHIEENICLKSR